MRRSTLSSCLLVSLILSVQATAPPGNEKGRDLTAAEKNEVDRLEQEFDRKINAGDFKEAVKTVKQIADYRAERQGRKHWEVLKARWHVKTWQRSPKDCAHLFRAFKIAFEGHQLQQRLRYREAEAKLREALAIREKVLGEQHPDTAVSYTNVAICLHHQGKRVEALRLHQKALAVCQKVLGEQHPSTANCYNNLAYCLNVEGKDAEALPLYRKALAICQNVLGEQHIDTAQSYNGVAHCLNGQGKHTEAIPLLQKALAIRQKVLGEQHDDTAVSYNNLALCLDNQGKHAEALPLLQKALAIFQMVHGELHPLTARSYDNVGGFMERMGKHAAALPLFRKALAIRQKLFGEDHPDTAISYDNVASSLYHQGKHVEALPIFRKALAIFKKMHGELHSNTANGYNNVASCLSAQGKHAEALVLFRKALAIFQDVVGEQHANTALSYNNVGGCLQSQGKHAEALPVFRKALAIRQKVLGEQHSDTATSYHNLAFCLDRQGQHAEALRLSRKALAIFQRVHGDQSPRTALSYNNVGNCLSSQGKHVEALRLHQQALAVRQKVLGEQHPDTAAGYVIVAHCLHRQGKHTQAVQQWKKALLGHEFGRLKAAGSGFERSVFRTENLSPRAALAVCLARLEKPLQAWEHAEANLARGLLDDLLASSSVTSDDVGELARLRRLDEALIPLLTGEELNEVETKRRDALRRERDDLLAELARAAVKRTRDRVLPLKEIQRQIPADAALVFWLDIDTLHEHLGCVLRRDGLPVWVTLPGSGKNDAWTDDDSLLPRRVLSVLSDGNSEPAVGKRLFVQMHRQRIAPLEPHLKNIKHLLVVPAGSMSAVPVEALTDRYVVSYVPSASIYARAMKKHRALNARSLLVLADPLFTRTAPKLPPAPPHGLLVEAVLPKSLAARVRLVPGDVLMEYHGKKLMKPVDLKPAADKERVVIKLWRDGKLMTGRIPSGKLGVVVDKKPIAKALAEWREREREFLALTRGRKEWPPLPGTRLEARTLAALVPETTVLIGSNASEQMLNEMASSGKLKRFRILHLATHGEANTAIPELSSLILAQDNLPTPDEEAEAALAGKRLPDGLLSVGDLLEYPDLDADLVVLSACQTGLGKYAGGEGMLGFAQALLQKKARTIVLSRWKVDDAATSLLMARFYQNLLGKREGLKQPMKRAEALDEAKRWLRNLTREEATKRLEKLVDGVPRGERGTIKAALPARKPDTPKGKDRPFAHPYYWAAFVLIGDPY